MRMRRGSGLVTALWLLLLGLPLAGAVAVPGSEDRLETMRAELAATGVYLEAGPAMGDLALWRQRLEKGVQEADLGVPLKVALYAEIPGVAPEESAGEELVELLGLDGAVAVVSPYGYDQLISGLSSRERLARVRAVWTRSQAVVHEVEQTSPQKIRYKGLTPVAQAWIFLRLAASDAPPPRTLIDELAGDVSLFTDHAEPPSGDDSMDSFTSPVTFVCAALVMALTVGYFVRDTLSRRRSAHRDGLVPRRPDPLAARLTPLVVEEELTRLSESIAASEVSPGDPTYDRAQACADAAGRYVDSDAERDRIGVHLLVAEGEAILAGEQRPERCFFNPRHDAFTAVKRKKVSLPCCASCAGSVTAGGAPDSLMVTGPDGRVRPYFETQDVWTDTGYGSIDERWARRALLAALERR